MDDKAKSSEAVRQAVERQAYARYCDRGCEPGHALDDWLAAEQEVLATHEAPPIGKSATHRTRGSKRR